MLRRVYYPAARAGRAEYLSGIIQGVVLLVGGGMALGAVRLVLPEQIVRVYNPGGSMVMTFLGVWVLSRVVFLCIRRLHDFHRSGLFVLLLGVPWLNLVFLLALLSKSGDVGENKYGSEPVWKQRSV